jgi:hypothetical protein
MKYGILQKSAPIKDAVDVNGFNIPVIHDENKKQIINGIIDDSTRFIGNKNDKELMKGVMDRALRESQAHTKTQEIANYRFSDWGCGHYGNLYQTFADGLKVHMNSLPDSTVSQKPKGIIGFIKSIFAA